MAVPYTTIDIQQGDVTTIRLTCKNKSGQALDISASTVRTLRLKKGGTTKNIVGSFTNDGTDGQINFVTENDTFDQVKSWQYQVILTFPTGDVHSKEGTTLYVGENL